jgi:hypothetical protein
MSEQKPTTRPALYPSFLTGVATVKGSDPKVHYTVDFNTGDCDCQHGEAWQWGEGKWVPNSLCFHKLRAVASAIEAGNDKLMPFYEQSIGKKHNAFVAVSAMHKELRRADAEAALYWSVVMIPHRGIHNMIAYLRNIVFEETRDLYLYRYINALSSRGTSVTRLDLTHAIRRFAHAPKKWELPWRLDIFIDEMKAYKELADKYGYDVAKGSDIIAEGERPSLHKRMLDGFKKGDRVSVQYGLKGLYKAKAADQNKYRIGIFNYLTEVFNHDFPNKFEYDHEYVSTLHDMLLDKIARHGAPGYHELNALADGLTGEPGRDPRASLPAIDSKRHTANPTPYSLPLGDFRKIPLYANDNHTWPGKALLRSYGATELQPGVPQTHIDFRYWGAYGGVAWRHLAFKQHATIDCKWQDVSWRQPPWLWGHVERMNY